MPKLKRKPLRLTKKQKQRVLRQQQQNIQQRYSYQFQPAQQRTPVRMVGGTLMPIRKTNLSAGDRIYFDQDRRGTSIQRDVDVRVDNAMKVGKRQQANMEFDGNRQLIAGYKLSNSMAKSGKVENDYLLDVSEGFFIEEDVTI